MNEQEKTDYVDLVSYAVEAFANDGRLDPQELDKLLSIASRDGKIDEDETRVLKNVLSRLRSDELSLAMRDKLRDVERKYGVSLL